MRNQLRWVLLLVVFAAGCSGGTSTVDGVEITSEDVAVLHVDVDELNEDERAGSLLLLILHEAFTTAAGEELNVPLDATAVSAAYNERVVAMEGRGGVDTVLPALNQTPARLQIESELDTIRDSVAEELVRSEAADFDLDAAYEGYLLVEAEVCIRLMQLSAAPDFDVALERLDAGETFATVARDISIDPFVGRDEGVGAGGDIGCSAPNALPVGLGAATLAAPLNEPTGPITAETGLYLVEVYERSAADLADVRDEVMEFAVDQQGPELFRIWAVAVLQEIDVEVASEFGSWAMLPETDPVRTVVPPSREQDIIAGG